MAENSGHESPRICSEMFVIICAISGEENFYEAGTSELWEM